MNDPLKHDNRSANLGGAAMSRGGSAKWELADVVAYNSATHTAIVRTHRGRPLQNVPQMKDSPGEFENFRVGTSVVISWDLGFPVIIGCLNFVGPTQPGINAPSLTGISGIGDDNPLQPTTGSNSYKPANAPSDMTNGDWAQVGTFGNHVAVLEGGVSLFGSTTAQVRSLGLAGILQTIARQTQTFTDFGNWRVENDAGRTSFILRAGSNTATQTGLDEEHWSIRLDVGATGDLFNFEITDPQGHTTFRFYVSPDGRVQIYGGGGVDISSGPHADAETVQDINGAREVTIGGSDTLHVGGTHTVTVEKDAVEAVAGDKTTVVSASEARFTSKDSTSSTGGKTVEIFTGGLPQDAKSGNVALTTSLVNGGWVVDIGNPSAGANITAEAAFRLKTSLGNVSLESGGEMFLQSRLANRIEGATVEINGNAQHAVRGDDMRNTFNNFVALYNAFVKAYEFHSHPTGTGPSGAPLPLGVPPIPNPYVAAPLGNPWMGQAYVADPGSIHTSHGSPFPLPPQPVAAAATPMSKMPVSNLSSTVKLT